MRKVCPVESYCVTVVGRVWPKIEGKVTLITDPKNVTDATGAIVPEPQPDLAKFEGKDFVRRECQPVVYQREGKCTYCPMDE